MKKLLTLALLSSLLLPACGETEETGDDDSLLDMYDTDDDTSDVNGDEDVDTEEEVPTSIGPTDIPDDLIPSR